MGYTPITTNFDEPYNMLRIGPFEGVQFTTTPTEISPNKSPDMLNMVVKDKGALIVTRPGTKRIYSTSLGAGQINGLYEYRKQDGTTYFLIAHGTKLYTQSGENQPTEIYNGLVDDDILFFTFGDKCYIKDGTNFLVYDGTNVTDVSPYIPTITIASGSVATGYTAYEDWNLLGTGFKETRSGDNSTTVFPMSQVNLDADTVTCTVDGVVKVENTDFTVDRINGTITFNVPPSTGTNNIEWIAYKTYSGYADKINQCMIHTIYGGANDTRVFLAHENFIYRSGLYDATYWPENGFYKFDDIIQGFSKQYEYLVVHKLNGKHQITYTIGSDGLASFPSKPINDETGTIAPKSIQLIDNSPISLSKNGVYAFLGGSVKDERNVTHISDDVDLNLLNETNLENAISIDYDRKYILAINGNVYVMDYDIKTPNNPFGIWYPWDNIHASCFLEKDGYLYFGSNSEGLVYRFKKEDETQPYNDDGVAINSYWYSKYLTFGADERLKLIEKVFFSLKPHTHASADLYYITNKKQSDLVKTARMDLLDFNDLDFSEFSFMTSTFPQETMAKIKAKKVSYFQLIFKNDNLDESMGILSIGIQYKLQSEVK